MKTIQTMLKEEVKLLERIARNAEKRLKHVPTGNLRVRQKGRKNEYYYREEGSTKKNGRYLKKDERVLAAQIAQRDFDRKVAGYASERSKAIKDFLEKYERTSLKRLYEKTSRGRKDLIVAEVVSDEEFAMQWQKVKYKGKAFEADLPEIFTERGERVRSKSEKIIADKLQALGISYRYEHPLVMKNGLVLYPDFTILKFPERKEVYLEHFGMMDDPKYVEKAVRKLITYEKNGIYLGINLFVTFEEGNRPISTRTLNELLGELFVAR